MLEFRDILKEREERGQTKLLSCLHNMEETAKESFLNLLGERHGAYAGIPHCRNVERHLNQAVSDYLKRQFSSTEVFLLLSSVLFHDISKSSSDNDAFHSQESCMKILEEWSKLKIPEEDLATWIAVLCCSHTWEKPEPPKKCKYQRKCNLCGESNGRRYSHLGCVIRFQEDTVVLERLGALLRLADEVDSQKSRAVEAWLQREGQEMSWRHLINSVVFDYTGECIKLKTLSLDCWDEEERGYLQEALENIDKVLQGWEKPLVEMGLNFSRAFLEVSFPAPALYQAKDIGKEERSISIEPRLKNPALLEQIKAAMLRLDNAVVLKEGLFSWGDLAEESNLGDVAMVKLAAERLRSMHDAGDGCESQISDPPPIVCSEQGWMLRNNRKAEVRSKLSVLVDYAEDEQTPEVIQTGIDKLDELLCPYTERERLNLGREKGGFYAPTTKSGKWLAPIVAVEGSAAEGKTTLSLQIACNLVGRGEKWTCMYYSLEKKPESIKKLLEGHSYFSALDGNEESIINLEKKPWYELEKSDIENKLILARLSPLPVGKISKPAEEVFEQRYSELKQSLEWSRSEKKKVFYFVDSLTAFSNKPLSRIQVYRLLSLFEMMQTPVIVTLERQRRLGAGAERELPCYDYARYMADIVIRLDHEYVGNYYRQTLEVAKSRYNRRILGRHLMKIKSPSKEATGKYDDRHGIVVYHSIHNHIVHSRSEKVTAKDLCLDISPQQLPVGDKTGPKTQTIKSDTCIVISGPLGGHKFAVGVNLLLRTERPEKRKRRLIVSFAEEREIKLQEVALLEKMSPWREKLKPQKQSKSELASPIMKVWEQHFGDGSCNYLTLLNLRLGHIMPEEFLHIFEGYLESKENEDIDALLFTDTAQLRTRFPLLHDEPLFIPAVVDIIKSRGLLSIFIDVMEGNRSNAPLMAAADGRIYIERLEEELTNYIRLDNVRGKDYDRDRRIISADLEGGHYVLKIENIPKPSKKASQIVPIKALGSSAPRRIRRTRKKGTVVS